MSEQQIYPEEADPELEVDQQSVLARGAEQLVPILSLVLGQDKEWTEGSLLADVRWTPHMVWPDAGRVLHVHLSNGAPRYISRRLKEAAEKGHHPHVALPLESLYDADVVRMLSESDTYVYVLQGEDRITKRCHHLAALADCQVPVEPAVRTEIGRAAWARRAQGSDNQRGRRLEALLAFLLSQVTDFRVIERNFRSATAEIDVIVQIDNFSTRCWNHPGVPFIFAEAKNRIDKAGQSVISILIRRLETSRGRARLGMAFSVGGFTADAKTEELRLSATDYCVAFFDSDAIVSMIEAKDLDDFLEKHVTKAMLR